MIVPNEQPTITHPTRRIALIGEAPGAEEDACGRPFMGVSGRLLWGVASRYGITREASFVGNICQVRPPSNNIDAFDWTGNEIQTGLAILSADLADFKPNLVVLLGNTPLKAFTGETGITNWRGSLFKGRLGDQVYKCLAALHPAAVLRDYTGHPLLHFDLKRAASEGETPNLVLPQRNLQVNLDLDTIICKLNEIKREKPLIAIDIEGGIDSMSCISFARAADDSFIVPFTDSFQDNPTLVRALADVLSDPSIPKVLQNSLYDTFVLQWSYHIPVRGVVDDTMLKHWELYCELPKSLGFQCSIYTREPYYKEDRHTENLQTFYEYCCKDSATTYEINQTLEKQITGTAKTHYRLNMQLLEPILYMQLHGIAYDKEKALARYKDLQRQAFRLQHALDQVAGIPTPRTSEAWLHLCRDAFCFKKEAHLVNGINDVVPHSKTTCLDLATTAVSLLSKNTFDFATCGELSTLVTKPQDADKSWCLNVESKNQMADFLYRQLGLPPQFKKEHGKLTNKITTDVVALLTLYKKTSDPTIKLILKLRSIRTRCESLLAATDGDGRIRCAYNLVGTETGRLSCYESPTGSGFNLQTVTKRDRDLFLPDSGYWLFECDLSGADGWSVAAHCYALGDPTMLEDLRAGLKPAKIVALLYQHGGVVNRWSREEIALKSKAIEKDGWLYFASKQVYHATNYGVGPRTGTEAILKQSYKIYGEPIYISTDTFENLQNLFHTRYPGVRRWHKKCEQQLVTLGTLTSANGHKRVFFGRKKDPNGKVSNETLKQFLADEPQNNTTYATNLALHKLWTDPENRVSGPITQNSNQAVQVNGRVSLRIQPLHQVHDALVGQFRKDDVEWALTRIRSYFNNELVIAGQRIVIPYEGAYGESWGCLKQGEI